MDKSFDAEIQQYLNELYSDNALKLRRMIDRMTLKYGGISGKDKDDFYSIANYTISEIIEAINNPKVKKKYDPRRGNFKGYIYRAINLAIIDDIKYRNASKRSTRITDEDGEVHYLQTISMDTPIGEDKSLTVGDFLCNQSDEFDIFQTDGLSSEFLDENIQTFLSNLTYIQREILRLKVEEDRTAKEIQSILGITRKQYEIQLKEIKSYENISVLQRVEPNRKGKEDECMTLPTKEKTKDTHIPVSAMRKKLRNREWRDDHLLQRYADMWSLYEQSELIVDMLHGKSLTQIIVSEEIKNGISYRWLIDGKQRCTNINKFCEGLFAISKKVECPIVEYQVTVRDENGEIKLDDDGYPMYESRSIDVRNKKFGQLPEELQDKILDYQIPVMLNLNCTSTEIAHDIARFNRSKQMNKTQKGWTGINEEHAHDVDQVARETNFFRMDFVGSTYTNNNKKNSEIRRVITDSILTTYFPNKYNKEFNIACKNFSEVADKEVFNKFISLVKRLEKVANKETAKVFNATNSKIWFAIFNKCSKYGISDEMFVEFVEQFNNKFHAMKVDGVIYDEIGNRDTKARTVLQQKISHLENLLVNYFNIQNEETATSFELDGNWCEYIEKFARTNLITNRDMEENEIIRAAMQTIMLINGKKDISDEAIQEYIEDEYIDEVTVEDIVQYAEMLNDYADITLKDIDSINASNIPVLISGIDYIISDGNIEDKAFEKCLPEWIKNWKNGVDSNSKIENYNMVISDLKNEIEIG